MLKGQIISGDFSKIAMRVKSNQNVEIGELVVIENNDQKFILQVFDLIYSSQISQQNLEMVAGMNLEEGNFNIMDEKLRNYQLALLKPILNVSSNTRMCKKLPDFFSKVRSINKDDLTFIVKPNNPFFLGKLRSGSKLLAYSYQLLASLAFAGTRLELSLRMITFSIFITSSSNDETVEKSIFLMSSMRVAISI